jgi:tetratricopeptide (TPR) repeat protein
MRQYDRAIAEAQKALELDPQFPNAHEELAKAYVLTGKYGEAIATTQKELDRGQQHPRVLGMLGYAYAAAGKQEQARKVLVELK